MTRDEVDALIERKRAELKELLFLRFAMAEALPAAPPEEAEDDEAPARPHRRRLAAAPPADRRDLIRARAAAVGTTPPPTPGKRRSHTPEFKLAVLEEIDNGRPQKDVLQQHQLAASVLIGWRKKRDAGTLKPTPLGAYDRDVVETEPEAPSAEVADEDHDLVDAMAEREEGAREEVVPFDQEAGSPRSTGASFRRRMFAP